MPLGIVGVPLCRLQSFEAIKQLRVSMMIHTPPWPKPLQAVGHTMCTNRAGLDLQRHTRYKELDQKLQARQTLFPKVLRLCVNQTLFPKCVVSVVVSSEPMPTNCQLM